MKILLFYPPITIHFDDTTQPALTEPLGISYIASYIESKGYNVSIIDALAEGFENRIITKNSIRFGLSETQIIEKIKYYNPDIVGISIMFTSFSQDAHDLAKLIKKINNKIIVVLGGAHASVAPKNILKDKNIDIVVIGEGEETFLEIIKKFEKKQKLTNILGTATKINKKIIINKPRPFIKNLDTIPFPARNLLPMDLYLRNTSLYDIRHPTVSMFTSRGCPNNCIYCAVPGIWGRLWRPFSAIRVVDEIEFLIKRYGYREVHFLDDNISIDRNRLNQICDLIIKRKIDIKWTCPNGIAIWTLDKQLLKKMKKSGCYRLTFGIESGSINTQKFIRKNLNLDKANQIIKLANKLGFWTFSTYIIGFPYESNQDLNKTINHALNSYTDFVAFILLMPFPGTDITSIMIKEKLIKANSLFSTKIGAFYSGYKSVGNKYFSSLDLKQIQDKAHKRLLFSRLIRPLFNPAVILNKLKNYEDFRYLLKILSNYFSMLTSTIKLKEFKTHRVKQAINLNIINRK